MTQYNLQGLQDPTGMRRTDLSSTASDDATAAALLRGVPIPTVENFLEGDNVEITVSGPDVTIAVDVAALSDDLETAGFPKVDDITALSPITRAFTAPNKVEFDFDETAALALSNASNTYVGTTAAISSTIHENSKRIVVPDRVTAGAGISITPNNTNGTVVVTNTGVVAEADTLDTVADRGATTNQSITVGGLHATGTQLFNYGRYVSTNVAALNSDYSGLEAFDSGAGPHFMIWDEANSTWTTYNPVILAREDLECNAFNAFANSSVTGDLNVTSDLSENSKKVVVPDRVTAGTGISIASNNTNGTVVVTNTGVITEADTLDSVTDRGNITSNDATFGNLAGLELICHSGVISINPDNTSSDWFLRVYDDLGPDEHRIQFDTSNGWRLWNQSTSAFDDFVAGDASFSGTTTLGGGTPIAKHLSATASLNFDLTAVTVQDLTMTVTGAALGDTVCIGVPHGSVTTSVQYTGWVSASDTVTIRARTSAAGENPASGTFRADVWKH